MGKKRSDLSPVLFILALGAFVFLATQDTFIPSLSNALSSQEDLNYWCKKDNLQKLTANKTRKLIKSQRDKEKASELLTEAILKHDIAHLMDSEALIEAVRFHSNQEECFNRFIEKYDIEYKTMWTDPYVKILSIKPKKS